MQNEGHGRDRSDHNRARRIEAVRELEQLLALAVGPTFDGTVSIEVSAKGGVLGRVRRHITNFGPEVA